MQATAAARPLGAAESSPAGVHPVDERLPAPKLAALGL
jgi:hypothetical protein